MEDDTLEFLDAVGGESESEDKDPTDETCHCMSFGDCDRPVEFELTDFDEPVGQGEHFYVCGRCVNSYRNANQEGIKFHYRGRPWWRIKRINKDPA